MTKAELLQVAKPILFNTEMVRAILDNRKSVTRRVVKPQLPKNIEKIHNVDPIGCLSFKTTDRYLDGWQSRKPKYQVGDILYVRETFGKYNTFNGYSFVYKADYIDSINLAKAKALIKRWRPSIHMPKEVARIFLKVTGVWVERLQDITEEQAIAEGFKSRNDFITAILKMYPDCTEESFLWVYEFERMNVDE